MFDLHFVWPPTCVDFGPAQIRTQGDEVFHGLATQRKSIRVDPKSFVKYTTFYELRELANSTQVRTQVLLLQTFLLLLQTCESVWPGLYMARIRRITSSSFFFGGGGGGGGGGGLKRLHCKFLSYTSNSAQRKVNF